MNRNVTRSRTFARSGRPEPVGAGGCCGAQTMTAPKYKFDPDWPEALPNRWKMGGVTGLAVDKDDNVWVLDRPNDLTRYGLRAEIPAARRLLHPASGDDPHRQGR